MQKNPRYVHFRHTYLTAGDSDQFEKYVDIVKYDIMVKDTFNYIFHKFKKGVFVHIKDNTIFKFVPFCKANFINECVNKMHVDTGTTFQDMFDIVKNMTHSVIDVKYNTIYGWWNNNGIFRYEIPKYEVDTGLEHMYKLLQSICDTKRLNGDCIFFINKRDFPIKTDTNTEPYECIWGDGHPLISHCYSEYCPILSMTTTLHYSDIPMPTWDDCKRIFNKNKCTNGSAAADIQWCNKKSVAVFRGTSTGMGTTCRNNMRLKVLKIGKDNPDILDVGLTKWNTRPRKTSKDKFYNIISLKIIQTYPLKEFLTYEEQSKYKYIINIPGHTTSFRLSTLLGLKSVVLHVPHKYYMWFEPMLKPYVHYVPVRSDLQDLVKQIKWCIKNDDICKNIVNNANIFYNKYLSKTGVIEYMLTRLNDIDNGRLYHYGSHSNIKNVKNIPEYVFDGDVKMENILMSQVCKNKSFYIIDNCFLFKKHMGDNQGYYNECDMWFNYLSKLSFIYGFRPILGIYKKEFTVMNYIDGISLYDYLQLPMNEKNFNIVVECLLQICIILDNAYYTCNFIHNDCTPWNIILSVNPHPSILTIGNGSNTFVFETSQCSVHIIDYEKSRITTNDKEKRDVFNLIVHVLFMILLYKDTWHPYVINICVQLFHNIFPEHPGNKISTIQDILDVLSLFKKYDNMTSTCLENVNANVKLYEPMFLYNMLQKLCTCPSIKLVDFPNLSNLHKLSNLKNICT